MMRPTEPLGRYVSPNLDEARLTRQRAAIMERAQRRTHKRWPFALAAAATICVAAVMFFVWRPHAEPTSRATAGTIVEAPAEQALPITLIDGSRVVLAPNSKLSLITLLPTDIHLELARGGVDLDVTHVENRQFIVIAAGYEVRVVGTRFSVQLRGELENATLEVRVARGRVRVTRVGDASDARMLGAGETWSTALGHSANDSQPTPLPTLADSFALAPPLPPSSSSDTSGLTPSSSSVAPSVVRAEPDSKELWAQAERASAAYRFREEASALDALRRKHRSDPRAGLAAFELGRLRQDTLHDPAGAAEAFGDAVVLAPTGPFREDAEARRVEAFDTAGEIPQCIDARNAFLARYPSSIHRESVSKRCNAR